MSTQTEQPFAWIRQIPGDLFQLDEKPLLGNITAFPLTEFSSQLAKTLQIEGLTIEPSNWEWRSKEELSAGMSDNIQGLSLTLTPLPGLIWWVMPERDVARLMGLLLTKQSDSFRESIDHDFFTAFYQFIALEALNVFDKVNSDKKLSSNISKEQSLPAEHCLSMDVTINIQKDTFHGRVLLSSEFRKAWKQRYFQQQPGLMLTSPIANSLDVEVHLEAGRVNLKPSEWKQLKTGDFLLLDSCSLDADEDKGRVMMVINGFPLFRAKLKQGNLKILEHPLYHEVDTVMNSTPTDDASEHDEFEDEDFDIEEESKTGETNPAKEEEENDFDIDELNDLDLDEASEEEKKQPQTQAALAAPTDTPSKGTIEEKSAPGSIDEIPLSVVVEVGRVQMSIKKLLELQPGNMLELNIHPEAGVDLVVNGKRIARGELLRIGDALGVRILELS